MGLFSLTKRRLQGDHYIAFVYPNEATKKAGEEFLFFKTRVCSNRRRGNGFKLKGSRFRLDTRKKFYILTVVRHWHRLP